MDGILVQWADCNADLKIFLTASVKKRAERRFEEFRSKYPDIMLDEVEKEIETRDWKDSHRESITTQTGGRRGSGR